MRTRFAVLAVVFVSSFTLKVHCAPERPVAPPMGIGLAGVASYSPTWQFVDMMKYSREWRTRKVLA